MRALVGERISELVGLDWPGVWVVSVFICLYSLDFYQDRCVRIYASLVAVMPRQCWSLT